MAYQIGVQRASSPAQVSRRAVFYLVLILYSIITAIPFLWALATSFKPETEAARRIPTALPLHPTLAAWTGSNGVFTADFPRYFLNSTIVAVIVTIGNLFFDSLAGYAFARMRFPGRDALFLLVLGTTMIPVAMTLVPVFVILTKLGWINTYQGLAVPFMVTAFGIFLMRQFFQSIPVEIEEAAEVDGLSRFGMYWRLALPLSRPALATLGILTFQGNWDSFMMPSFIASTDNMATLPVGLQRFSFQYLTLWPQVMAGSMVVIIPILIIYVFAQRYFIEGMSAGAVKG